MMKEIEWNVVLPEPAVGSKCDNCQWKNDPLTCKVVCGEDDK
jgi:hypothetical protein